MLTGEPDETGYLEAKVNEHVGLVPIKYLFPMTAAETVEYIMGAETVRVIYFCACSRALKPVSQRWPTT